MKTDRYTQFILTVIALCLAWLCFNNPPRSVQAQSQMHIVIDDVIPHDTRGLPVWITRSQR